MAKGIVAGFIAGFIRLVACGQDVPVAEDRAGLSRAAGDKPNIIFILLDDLGKEWLSCYGANGS